MQSVICLRGSPFKYCCSTFVRLLLSTGERSWRIGVLWWQKYSNMSYAHKHKGPPFLTPPPIFSFSGWRFCVLMSLKNAFGSDLRERCTKWISFKLLACTVYIIVNAPKSAVELSEIVCRFFFKRFWQRFSLLHAFLAGNYMIKIRFRKRLLKFFQHSFMVFAHTETLLTAIDGFIYAAF